MFFEPVRVVEEGAPELGEVTIEFDRRSTVGAVGPCNFYGGEYNLRGTKTMRVASLRATMSACELEILNAGEARYFHALQDVQAYSVDRSLLKLYCDQGRRANVFVRAAG